MKTTRFDSRNLFRTAPAALLALGLLAACDGGTAGASEPAKAQQDNALAKAKLWKGTGTMFDSEGQKVGDYEVELTRQRIDKSVVEHEIRVLIPNREPMVISQRIEEGERGFSISSKTGSGGGLDLGDGLITTYTVDPKGVAHASTIVMDGETEMRIVRYELIDGKAVRFFREHYQLTGPQER